MASGRRDQITMSPQEVAAFLDNGRWMVLGTIGPSGWPHLVTVGYHVHEGDLVFTSYAKAQKIVNLERNPQVSCLVEDVGGSYAEVRGVLVHGYGRVLADRQLTLEMHEAAGRRAEGWPVNNLKPMDEFVTKRVAVRVEAVQITSWDHTRLGGVY